jgi:phage terminase large subunit-like protein
MSTAAQEQVDDYEGIGPQPGPQTMFAECGADIGIFGGGAGGGKSNALVYEAVKHTQDPNVIGYQAIIFRRTTGELTGLINESRTMYTAFGGRYRGTVHDWTFEAASRNPEHRHTIKFSHLEQIGDMYKHQGQQYAFVGFDELTHFEPEQFWYLMTRLRSMCGVKPYIRATCNPKGGFVRELVNWYIDKESGFAIPERSGAIRWLVSIGNVVKQFATEEEARASCPPMIEPLTFTFIASKLSDNKILLQKDPSYASRVAIVGGAQAAALLGYGVAGYSDGVDRGGNWNEYKGAGAIFDQHDVIVSDEPPSEPLFAVRAWDQAATKPSPEYPNPDWTRGVKVWRCRGGEYWIEDIASMRLGAGELLPAMRAVAEADGPSCRVAIWQDSAGAGKLIADTTRTQAFSGFIVDVHASGAPHKAKLSDMSGARSSNNKVAWAESIVLDAKEKKIWAKKAEWNGVLRSELHEFPRASKDDCVDALVLAIHQLRSMHVGDGFVGKALGKRSEAQRMRAAI